MQQEKKFQFKQACKRAGLRLTPQRLAIFETLACTDEHPSAEMVYQEVKQQLSTISFDTVNRTLQKFAEVGAAFIVEGSGDSKRYDADFSNHQHFKCVKCKRIIDFKHRPFNNVTIPINISDQFEVFKATVYIEGLCDRCKNWQVL